MLARNSRITQICQIMPDCPNLPKDARLPKFATFPPIVACELAILGFDQIGSRGRPKRQMARRLNKAVKIDATS